MGTTGTTTATSEPDTTTRPEEPPGETTEATAQEPTTGDGTAPPTATLENADFESGLAGWTKGFDLPDEPGNPGTKVDASAVSSTERASSGARSVRFTLDGSADDGTVWVQQEADLSGVDTLTVDGYSRQESFNTIAELAVYAGPVPETGLSEVDFDRSQATEDHEGWKTYEYAVDHDGPGLVAVGINVVWETTVRRYLDSVRLR